MTGATPAAIGTLRELLAALPASLFESLAQGAECTARALRQGGCAYFLGNGGSAAQAEHLAAELVGRFLREREPYRAVALTGSGSMLTAAANDYAPSELFTRSVRALVRKDDVLVALSTSGRSPNVLRACEEAKRAGAFRIAFTGRHRTPLARRCDCVVAVPADSPPRIQEIHLVLGHLFCERIEEALSTGDWP